MEVVADVLTQRVEHREGPVELALRCGTSARTVSRILARAGMPRLWDLDPVTGARIRASRATDRRYERDAPGDLIHIDVKDSAGSPTAEAGGPTLHRARPTTAPRAGTWALNTSTSPSMTTPGSLTPRSCPTKKGPACAGFLTRAAAVMAANGAPVKRVMIGNAFAYRLSRDFQHALAALDAKHILLKPRNPWQNGKAERFNRTLQEGWAYRQPFMSNQARTEALQPWLHFYNTPPGSLGGKPPISRCNQPTG